MSEQCCKIEVTVIEGGYRVEITDEAGKCKCKCAPALDKDRIAECIRKCLESCCAEEE